MSHETRNRIIIFSTIMLPAFFGLAWWLMLRYYLPDIPWNNISYEVRNDKLIGADGSDIPFTFIKSKTGKKNKIVLMVSELARDRNWNTKGISTRVGKRLAITLGKSGYDSIRFDQRGTGQSKASLQTIYNISLKLSDIRNVYLYLLKQYGYSSNQIVILAHGYSGCNYTLESLKNLKEFESNIILINCGGPGNFLDTWARRIFINMRHRGVPENTIRQARMEWSKFVQSSQIQPVSKKTHSDIATFRNTITYFHNKHNQKFLDHSKKIFFARNIQLYLNRQITIHHFHSQYDSEFFREETDYIKTMAKKYTKSGNYHFHYLKNSDHLIRDKFKNENNLFIMIKQNFNPFIKINLGFLNQLKKILG